LFRDVIRKLMLDTQKNSPWNGSES